MTSGLTTVELAAPDRAPVRFGVRSARIALVVAGTCLLLVGVAGLLADGGHTVASTVAAAAGLVLVIRGYHAETVVVEADRVVVVGFSRRHAIDLAALSSAESRLRAPGCESHTPEVLVLNLRDGRSLQFRELSARRPRSERPSVVDEAVAYINAMLARPSTSTAHP